MSTDLVHYEPRESPVAIIERVVIQGDLAKLTVEERLCYYRQVCDSLGLNPLTQPFQYITLNGKLTLYARKDATDQLRRIHDVSIKITSRDRAEDVYAVTALASLPTGRTDESIGAVSLAGLKGETLANALMKAETKAKRRATLSICGLGMLDEMEIETIPQAQSAPEAPPRKKLPVSGSEFATRTEAFEAKLVMAGRCERGEFLAYLRKQGELLGAPPDLVRWNAAQIKSADDWRKTFLALHPAKQPTPPVTNGTASQPAKPSAITAEQLKALRALMDRKGGEKLVWPLVRAALDLGRLATPETLPADRFDEVMKGIAEESDARH